MKHSKMIFSNPKNIINVLELSWLDNVWAGNEPDINHGYLEFKGPYLDEPYAKEAIETLGEHGIKAQFIKNAPDEDSVMESDEHFEHGDHLVIRIPLSINGDFTNWERFYALAQKYHDQIPASCEYATWLHMFRYDPLQEHIKSHYITYDEGKKTWEVPGSVIASQPEVYEGLMRAKQAGASIDNNEMDAKHSVHVALTGDKPKVLGIMTDMINRESQAALQKETSGALLG